MKTIHNLPAVLAASPGYLNSIYSIFRYTALPIVLLSCSVIFTTGCDDKDGSRGPGKAEAPVIEQGDAVMVSCDEDNSPNVFTLQLKASDPNGGALTWSVQSQAANGVAVADGTGNTKLVQYTPNQDWNGTDSFVIQVSDGELTDSITVTARVFPINDPPSITEGESTAFVVDPYSSSGPTNLFYLNATDIDSVMLSWSIVSQPLYGTAATAGFGAVKSVSYTPTDNWNGSDSFVVQVSDGEYTDSITVNVTKRQIQRRDPLAILHELKYPARIAQGADGKYYVTDPKVNSVFIYDATMTLIAELSNQSQPLGVVVDGDGKIYVGNAGRKCIEVYGADGHKVNTIGRGELVMPNDIAMDTDGTLYVVDSRLNAVKVFAHTGELIRSIGDAAGNGALNFPVSLALKEGFVSGNETASLEIFVADQRNKSVKVFDGDGLYLRTLNGVSGLLFSPVTPATKGVPQISNMGMFGSSPFVRIQSVAVDDLGDVHVLDSFTHEITVLDAANDGIKRTYGAFGKEVGGLHLPLDIMFNDLGEPTVTNARSSRVDTVTEN